MPASHDVLRVQARSRRSSRPLYRYRVVTRAQAVQKKVVIVGAGWAGFGAAKHLASQGYDVKLLDGSPNPGGLSTGWRTKEGKAVEAGMKGFWYQYPNIYGLVRELGIPNPFTPFTTSGFWSPEGLTTSAPIFSEQPKLPALIGQFVYTNPLFRRLSLADRFTMIPWLSTIIDYDSSPETYERYDRMSALDMFRSYGISKNMYEGFIKPTLLISMFAPPEELSAGATMGMLYFYGPVAELIFKPLIDRITSDGCQVLGGQLVKGIKTDENNNVTQVVARDVSTGEDVVHDTDALIFAVGITGMQKLIQANPVLAEQPDFGRMMNLKGIDVVSTRIWLDRRIATQFPANVLSGFDDTMGSTYFNLNDLHDEYKDSTQSVIASDFYHSNTIMHLSDEAIVEKVKANLDACEPAFKLANVVDYAVLRFPKAVTHFSPGSYPNRPFQATSLPNVFMAGDWVKGVDNGANGLSQERAYVTGLIAANLVCSRLGVGQQCDVLDVEPDEAHIKFGKDVMKGIRRTAKDVGLQSPLL